MFRNEYLQTAQENSRETAFAAYPVDTDASSFTGYVDVRVRADMYRFLTTVFLEPPTPDLVASICDALILDDLASVFGEAAISALRRYAEFPDMDVAELRQEYMDIFSVPTGRYVMPFEDVYLGMKEDGGQERGPLLGEQAIAVQQIYRITGAEMHKTRNELPNHVGIELAFMSFLCEREAALDAEVDDQPRPSGAQSDLAALAVYRQLQRQFLKRHLLNWFPKLSRAIQANSRTLFYQGLGQLTEVFIAWDSERLDSLPLPETTTDPVEGLTV
jgi:TorA maturation chaperone TorD